MSLKLRSKNDWGRLDMTSEWNHFALGEITELVIDYRGKTPKKLGGDWCKQGYRALSAKNIKTGRIVQAETIRYIDESLYRKWMKDEVQRGDILITSEAPFGQIFFWDSDEKIVLSQRLFCVRIKPEYDARFIYYYMTTPEFQSELDGRATGTTVIGLRQPELMKCIIRCPEIQEQKVIAAILSSIDAKIIANEKVNDNLYAQAKAIFDNHFINIDAIPAGWRKGNLLDIANYLNGLAMQKFRPQGHEIGLPVLKIKELRQGSCDDSSELCSLSIKPEYIIHNGDVIFSWSGSLLVDIWCGGTCGLNQHLFKVTSDVYDKWFYYLWTAHHLARFIAIAADKATTMGHIKREELAKAEVLIPCEEDYTSFNSIMQPIFELIISNRIESRKLAALRDELLPKLMTGEIDVSDVQF